MGSERASSEHCKYSFRGTHTYHLAFNTDRKLPSKLSSQIHQGMRSLFINQSLSIFIRSLNLALTLVTSALVCCRTLVKRVFKVLAGQAELGLAGRSFVTIV